MNRIEFKKIPSEINYPSVSILMPVHRSFPENQQDKIRLKNLVNNALTRLKNEAADYDTKDITGKLQKLTDDIDFNHLMDGLAVFISSNYYKKLDFSFPVKERVIIDKTFALRDVVFGYNRSQPYLAVVIDEKNTRFFYCVRDSLNEVSHPQLPLKNFVHEIRSGTIQDASYNDRIHENEERLKNYLREIDKILIELGSDENIPFVIAGTTRQIALFKEITASRSECIGELSGNYGNTTAAELSGLIWPEAKNGFAAVRERVLHSAEKAIGAKKFATGIDEVWKLAKEGRGLTLLTEINYSVHGKITDNGFENTDVLPSDKEVHTDDAVDEIIEEVISRGGNVVFFENGKLSHFSKIAMILRY